MRWWTKVWRWWTLNRLAVRLSAEPSPQQSMAALTHDPHRWLAERAALEAELARVLRRDPAVETVLRVHSADDRRVIACLALLQRLGLGWCRGVYVPVAALADPEILSSVLDVQADPRSLQDDRWVGFARGLERWVTAPKSSRASRLDRAA